MLLLFDIDGTLLTSGGAGRRALARAFAEIHDLKNAMEGIRLQGSTDFTIVRDVFRRHIGRDPTVQDALQILDTYEGFLRTELESSRDQYTIMPGVHELLTALEAQARHALGLATGNIERGARIKLEPGDLNRYFAIGGFGSDAEARHELLRCAFHRGSALNRRRFGAAVGRSTTWVIGDTELDVLAARKMGYVSVGVLAGASQPDALRASEPDLLFESFEDPKLWTTLELERTQSE